MKGNQKNKSDHNNEDNLSNKDRPQMETYNTKWCIVYTLKTLLMTHQHERQSKIDPTPEMLSAF